MYETEANIRVEGIDEISGESIRQFREFREKVQARTTLPWGEHCTECIWPVCYTSCDLYDAREDGRCRRFLDGMVRMECPGSVNSYLFKVRFKRWGKLWAPGNVKLLSIADADRRERRDQRIGATLYRLPIPVARKFATTKRYSWKKRIAASASPSPDAPDLFVIECYNPGETTITLSVSMRAYEEQNKVPYQRLVRLPRGFHRECIDVKEITMLLNLREPFSVDLVPNDIVDGTALIFGLVDFVKCAGKPATTTETVQRSVERIKCVVWDLDNTLWNGILVEDGDDKLTLKPGIIDIIKELDGRGILHSIASKNNFDEVMAVLKKLGIDEYFLYPQVSWNPKSEALKTIARKLNIGVETIMLVDDSDFELAQVQSECPTVRVLLAGRYQELPEMPACKVPVSSESSSRRSMYQQQATREHAADGFGGDYFDFLRDCNLEIQIESLSANNLDRVHELTQRTNQMNFSGSRYQRALLEQIASTEHLDTYVISCHDRFGSYGIVGFSVVDSREPRMTDLAFSCRIQAKRVEHAFLAFLLRKYIGASGVDFWANFRKTPRNAVSGRVFQDIGMEESAEIDGLTSLVFRRDRTIPNDGIIRVVEKA